jgi:hypothetical protein
MTDKALGILSLSLSLSLFVKIAEKHYTELERFKYEALIVTYSECVSVVLP